MYSHHRSKDSQRSSKFTAHAAVQLQRRHNNSTSSRYDGGQLLEDMGHKDSIQLEHLIHETFPTCNVDLIHVVNDPQMYGMYLLRKEEMRYGDKELILYHVTTMSRALKSLKKGLDWRRSEFGCGVSFSDDADYANYYADHSPKEESRTIIVCAVLVNKTQQESGSRNLTVPTGGADTTVSSDGRAYVKYNDYDFYPLYLMYYRRTPEHLNESKYFRNHPHNKWQENNLVVQQQRLIQQQELKAQRERDQAERLQQEREQAQHQQEPRVELQRGQEWRETCRPVVVQKEQQNNRVMHQKQQKKQQKQQQEMKAQREREQAQRQQEPRVELQRGQEWQETRLPVVVQQEQKNNRVMHQQQKKQKQKLQQEMKAQLSGDDPYDYLEAKCYYDRDEDDTFEQIYYEDENDDSCKKLSGGDLYDYLEAKGYYDRDKDDTFEQIYYEDENDDISNEHSGNDHYNYLEVKGYNDRDKDDKFEQLIYYEDENDDYSTEFYGDDIYVE